MKPLKIGLRIWIAVSSLTAFLTGWVFLSHSNKPAPLLAVGSGSTGGASTAGSPSIAPLPTLQPLPSLDQLTRNPSTPQPQQSPSFSNIFSNSPQLRTRGS